jgi:hypothetical protein
LVKLAVKACGDLATVNHRTAKEKRDGPLMTSKTGWRVLIVLRRGVLLQTITLPWKWYLPPILKGRNCVSSACSYLKAKFPKRSKMTGIPEVSEMALISLAKIHQCHPMLQWREFFKSQEFFVDDDSGLAFYDDFYDAVR